MPMGRAEEKPDAPGRGDISRTRIVGEPDPTTATLDDWRAWRRELAALPQDEDNVRVAIAVADAQIAKLRRRKR